MNQILYFIIGYLLLLLIWGTICLLSYAISIAFKKPKIIQSVSGFSQVVYFILNFLFGLYLLYVGVSLFLSHSFIYLIIFILIGAGLFTWLVSLLAIPFLFIPVYFAGIVDESFEGDDMVIEEVLDKDTKVIRTTKRSDSLDRKLAGFFLADYVVNLIYIITHPIQYRMLGWWDYLITPLFFMAQSFVLFGVMIIIYNKIRHHKFIFKNKKYFLIQVFKTDLIVIIGIQVLAIILFFILSPQS